MPTIEEFLKKQNRDRIKREERITRRLLAEYRRLDRTLAGVYRDGEKGRQGEEEKRRGGEGEKGRKGDEPPRQPKRLPPLLIQGGEPGEKGRSGTEKRKRLKVLLDTVRAEIGKFGTQASAIIGQGQRDEIEYQRKSAPELLKLLGLTGAKIPPSGPENAPGKMGDGSKLADYFSKKLAPAVAARVKQAASNSAAAQPAAVVRKLKAAHGILLGRTLTTARTETMRAAREIAQAIYRENGIKGWVWHSQLTAATCDFCRAKHGSRHKADELLVSHPNCRCMPLPDKAASAVKPVGKRPKKAAPAPSPAVKPPAAAKKPRLTTFTGKLKDRDVRLEKVRIERIVYKKRKPEESERLRRAFDSTVRKKFAKHISGSPKNIAILKRAGLSDAYIRKLQKGRIPVPFQVHHKLPLDDGGDNSFGNLVLIKNHPYHKAISIEQNRLTRGLKPGRSRSIDWVVPPGIVYPAVKG